MTPLLTALVVSACVLGGGLIGLHAHRLLPAHHLTKETQDVIRLGTGMLSVMASLVLGLLIATAKTTYDRTDQDIRSYAAELALQNETLRDYGGDAAVPRRLLRQYTAQLLADNWPQSGATPPRLDSTQAGAILEHVREAIRALTPSMPGRNGCRTRRCRSTSRCCASAGC